MASFGEELQRERELRDISLREIADATNISVQFLEALEKNEFSELPGGVYIRGFIRSTARHLGLDEDETLDSYRAEVERQELALQNRPGAIPKGVTSPGSRFAETLVAASIIFTALLIGVIYWAGADTQTPVSTSALPAHDTALNARMKRSGAIPPHASSQPSRASLQPPDNSGLVAARAAEKERLIGIRARETTAVKLTCAGVVKFKADLWVGVERQFACQEPITLSAANSGALEYSIDASKLTLLGKPGQAVSEQLISGPGKRSASPAPSNASDSAH
jgi:cytoskeleton protein RodZ